MKSKFSSAESQTPHSVRWQIRLSILGAFAALIATLVACNTEPSVDLTPEARSTVAVDTTLPSSIAIPSAATEGQLPDEESEAREIYLENASRAIDLIGRTAPLLASIGLDASGAGTDLINIKNLAGAANGSFDLVLQSLDAEPVPVGLEELHTAILTSIKFYREAAQKLLDIPDTGEFDFFDFQRPFQTGGENFHEAGRLLFES